MKKATADVETVQSIVDQMVVYAPVASQVYKRNVEPGEFVSPGVPLFTLIDLDDTVGSFRPARRLGQDLEGRRPLPGSGSRAG